MIGMTQWRLAVVGLVLIWVLVMTSSAHSAASVVRIRASVRPKVSVTVVGTGMDRRLRVRANMSWTILAREADASGAQFVEAFDGVRTGDTGTLLPTQAPVVDFTVLANP